MLLHFGRRIQNKQRVPCALTIGCFDGVHLGHQQLLARLRVEAQARKLSAVLLTFEPHPRQWFTPGVARLSTPRDKLANLQATAWLDEVWVYRFNDAFAHLSASAFIQQVLIDELNAQYLLIGDDFKFGFARQGDVSLLATTPGLTVDIMPSMTINGSRVSSSGIRQHLAQGDLDAAAKLLGRPYQISGHVKYGQQRGRMLGIPTANIHLAHRHHPALQGICAVWAKIAGRSLPGVASLGTNPTVSRSTQSKLEVHLFDFDGDLYGQLMQVSFMKKLRDEAHYDSLDKLVEQIKIDIAHARAYLTGHLEEPQFLSETRRE